LFDGESIGSGFGRFRSCTLQLDCLFHSAISPHSSLADLMPHKAMMRPCLSGGIKPAIHKTIFGLWRRWRRTVSLSIGWLYVYTWQLAGSSKTVSPFLSPHSSMDGLLAQSRYRLPAATLHDCVRLWLGICHLAPSDGVGEQDVPVGSSASWYASYQRIR
jgi:hypothetical protein